jgi:hypothetical protein
MQILYNFLGREMGMSDDLYILGQFGSTQRVGRDYEPQFMT